MHRREVEMMATTIRERIDAYRGIGTMSDTNRIAHGAVVAVAKDLSARFKVENPSFRNDLFMTACGIENSN